MANDELQKLIDQVRQLHRQGEWDACIALCTEYINLDQVYGGGTCFY